MKDGGYLLGKAGENRNVLVFMPPLTIGHEEISGLLHALDMAFSRVDP